MKLIWAYVRTHLLITIGTAAVLVILLQIVAIGTLRGQVDDAMLRADSTAAAADTTHRLLLKALGDSTTAWQRRVIQAQQVPDAVDRELKAQRTALVQLKITVRALRSTSVASVRDSVGARIATFDVRSIPYTAHADVALPAAPGRGQLRLTVQLDTAHLGFRLLCRERQASVLVTAPSWLATRIDSTTQAPEVCFKPRTSSSHAGSGFLMGVGVGASVLLLLHAFLK